MPAVCSTCDTSLAATSAVAREQRQVIDIPAPTLEMVEHQVLHKACLQCQAVTAGSFPPDVTQPVQYGPRVKAAGVYLQVGQFLSYERPIETLHDLLGVAPSGRHLDHVPTTAATRLKPVEAVIVTSLR
jgi:transposase